MRAWMFEVSICFSGLQHRAVEWQLREALLARLLPSLERQVHDRLSNLIHPGSWAVLEYLAGPAGDGHSWSVEWLEWVV